MKRKQALVVVALLLLVGGTTLFGNRMLPAIWLGKSYLVDDREIYWRNIVISLPRYWWLEDVTEDRILLARLSSSRDSKTPVVRVSHASMGEVQSLEEKFSDECGAPVCRYTRERDGVIDYVVLHKEVGFVVLGAGYAIEDVHYVDEIVASISESRGRVKTPR